MITAPLAALALLASPMIAFRVGRFFSIRRRKFWDAFQKQFAVPFKQGDAQRRQPFVPVRGSSMKW